MQSVYLANQTCWSPTDKFTQELRGGGGRKKCKATPPPSLRHRSLSLAEVSFRQEQKFVDPSACFFFFLLSLCLCFPPVFLYLRALHPPSSLFPVFVFFIFVIGGD